MKLYGVVAEFVEPGALLAAAEAARKQGFGQMEAYTPFSVEGLAEAVGFRKNYVPLAVLVCALLGALTGYGLQLYSAAIDYPLNVGGRPLHSWPSFIPITFELTVLFASVGGLVAMLAMNGLPRLHHPIFNTPHFQVRSHSRFYLCLEPGDDSLFAERARRFFAAQNAVAVWEVAR